ncbi:MAG: four helix bundle protein [Bacteroidia bacterium]
MVKTTTFKGLIVWQKAHKLVLEVYKVSKKFPKEEVYALTSQLRRAAVSVPANIAEGYKKKTAAAKMNYLNISEGSLEEIKYYFILATDLEYLTQNEFDKLTENAEEVGRLLNGYYNGIKNN